MHWPHRWSRRARRVRHQHHQRELKSLSLDAHERRQRPEEAAEVGVVGLRRLGLRLRRRAPSDSDRCRAKAFFEASYSWAFFSSRARAPRRALLGASLLLVLAALRARPCPLLAARARGSVWTATGEFRVDGVRRRRRSARHRAAPRSRLREKASKFPTRPTDPSPKSPLLMAARGTWALAARFSAISRALDLGELVLGQGARLLVLGGLLLAVGVVLLVVALEGHGCFGLRRASGSALGLLALLALNALSAAGAQTAPNRVRGRSGQPGTAGDVWRGLGPEPGAQGRRERCQR